MSEDKNKLTSLDEGELMAEQQLKPELELHLIGIKKAYQVLCKVMETVPPMNLEKVSSSMKVASALLVRIANDMRTIAILSAKGYAIQAATIAAALYESALMIAYIGNDDNLANRWINHNVPTKSFISVSKMTLEALKKLGVQNSKKEKKNLYHVYEQLCQAKHGNPIFQKAHSFLIENNTVVAQPGPITTNEFVRVSWFVMENAINLVGIALQSFIRNHIKSNANNDIIDAFKDLQDLHKALSSMGARRYGMKKDNTN